MEEKDILYFWIQPLKLLAISISLESKSATTIKKKNSYEKTNPLTEFELWILKKKIFMDFVY